MQNILYISAFTVLQALLSTGIALVFGVAGAFFTANRSFFGKKFLLSLSSLPFCIPSLLIALGFVSFFGLSGTLNSFLKSVFSFSEPPLRFLYSFLGIIIAQGFYNFPLVMASVHDVWTTLPTEQQDAARLLGAGEVRIFRTVTIFELLPALASSCMLVFLYCFFSFMIILLFGGVGTSTLEVEIYKAARASLDFAQTFKLALCETALACLFVALYSKLEQKSSQNRGISFYKRIPDTKIRSFSEKILAFFVFAFILLFFIAPIFSIFYNGLSSSRELFTFSTFLHVFKMKGFFPSLRTTLLIAFASSLLSVFVAFVYSAFLRSFDSRGKNLLLKVLPLLPMCVSSVVTGVIIIYFVRKGNVFHLILAQVFLTWALAFRQIYASLSKLPEETIESARLLSANPLNLVFRIYLPSSVRSLLSAFGFCFAVSAGDTTLPLVLALPKFTTLSLFTYRLAGSYRFHEACASGMILGLLCAIVFAIGNKMKVRKAKGEIYGLF